MISKSSCLLILLTLMRLFTAAQPDQLQVGKHLFDDQWHFISDDIPHAGNRGFADDQWRVLDLPHDWSIEAVPEHSLPGGGADGFFPAGVGWYRKHFMVPASIKAKSALIYFEGVYMNAEVFINGHSLG
ncbi:hypothetical protein LL912_20930 [Niabella sp. CC-SYL272]|uniref:sugar-binding domain-containing protein n=1 Tax=Niabella agricola TaxID=2891571 RepID=UPI001F24DC63|nr:sugar-binding domain-containing protein [Niabella agricola]MCF3111264.1 hypothetical protein [Niabella agricola]